ncbi:MAG: hypothetical protein MRZ74_10820 [Blautia sp.]|nr:hypothetical protein [Blautia sp.]MDY5031357.1 hypothetical protein [Blautia sp.]
MITLLFVLLMIWVFGKMIGLAFRATWGLTKIIFGIVLLPLFLVGLVIAGFMSIALPILVVMGIVMLISKAFS